MQKKFKKLRNESTQTLYDIVSNHACKISFNDDDIGNQLSILSHGSFDTNNEGIYSLASIQFNCMEALSC